MRTYLTIAAVLVGMARQAFAQEVGVREFFATTLETLSAFLPSLIAALLILIAGWIVAKFLGFLVHRASRNSKLMSAWRSAGSPGRWMWTPGRAG